MVRGPVEGPRFAVGERVLVQVPGEPVWYGVVEGIYPHPDGHHWYAVRREPGGEGLVSDANMV